MTAVWRWKPIYVQFAYTIEDITDFFFSKLPKNKFSDFVRGWVATLALCMDLEAIESLKLAMEDAKHGRFLTHEEVFGKKMTCEYYGAEGAELREELGVALCDECWATYRFGANIVNIMESIFD